jgi:uncharacterized protein with HEPN domain
VVKLLDDMAESAAAIQSFTRGRTESDDHTDRQLRRATEREFEIIGEALHRLLQKAPALAHRISHTPKIVGFRNVLAHGYDSIRDPAV